MSLVLSVTESSRQKAIAFAASAGAQWFGVPATCVTVSLGDAERVAPADREEPTFRFSVEATVVEQHAWTSPPYGFAECRHCRRTKGER